MWLLKRYVPTLTIRTHECDLIWKKKSVFEDVNKDLEMRLPWVIQVGLKYNDKSPYKRYTEKRQRREKAT